MKVIIYSENFLRPSRRRWRKIFIIFCRKREREREKLLQLCHPSYICASRLICLTCIWDAWITEMLRAEHIVNICIRNTCSDNISKFRATVITSLIVAVQFSNFPSHIRFLLHNLQRRNSRGRKGWGGGEGDIANICGINNRGTKIHSKFETRSRQKERGWGGGKGLYASHKFLKSDTSKSHRHAAAFPLNLSFRFV